MVLMSSDWVKHNMVMKTAEHYCFYHMLNEKEKKKAICQLVAASQQPLPNFYHCITGYLPARQLKINYCPENGIPKVQKG